VLVERFARAVIDDGIEPPRILAITFTERAAGELRERVASRLLGAGERGAHRALESAYIGTFHGWCARLLRANGSPADVGPDFATRRQEAIAGWLRTRAFARSARYRTSSAPTRVPSRGCGSRADHALRRRARAITLDVYATLAAPASARACRYPRSRARRRY
jgi:ATP-dependent exoDNAse (exonuclease V) beta subunit